jgi:hypothetical protein
MAQNSFQLYEQIIRFVREQKENDPNSSDYKEIEKSFIKYITLEMQSVFNGYVNEQGFSNVAYKEDENGIRFIYIKPFSLDIDESVNSIIAKFDGKLDLEKCKQYIEEYNKATVEKKKDEKGRFIGFWLDLVSIAPKWYNGEKFYVDVYLDEYGEGSINFGIDDAAEIYQISLEE